MAKSSSMAIGLLAMAAIGAAIGAAGATVPPRAGAQLSRRAAVLGLLALPTAALASKDCLEDCNQNCARNAPQSLAYCRDTCTEYCAQPDRRDGLSGSVSAEAGETGFSSAFDYTNRLTGRLNSNVEYGTDRPGSFFEGTPFGRKLSEAAGIGRNGKGAKGASAQ